MIKQLCCNSLVWKYFVIYVNKCLQVQVNFNPTEELRESWGPRWAQRANMGKRSSFPGGNRYTRGRMDAVDDRMWEEENAGFNPQLNTHFSAGRIRESQIVSVSFEVAYNVWLWGEELGCLLRRALGNVEDVVANLVNASVQNLANASVQNLARASDQATRLQ